MKDKEETKRIGTVEDIMTTAKKNTYYFSVYGAGLAYEVLDVQLHQVYKIDEKGLFYLLKSIIDCPENFVEGNDGFIPITLDTDLKKVVEETREMSGYDDPETWSPPKDESKEENKTNSLEHEISF